MVGRLKPKERAARGRYLAIEQRSNENLQKCSLGIVGIVGKKHACVHTTIPIGALDL